jgi:cytochrome c1
MKKLYNRKSAWVFSFVLLITGVFLLFPGITTGGSTIRLYIFLSPDCPACGSVKQENLARLAQKLGCTIEPRYFDIDDIVNYQKLCDLEEKYRKTDNELPATKQYLIQTERR